LTIFDKQAPDSLFVSDAFVDLGLVARLRGKLKVAEDLHQRALRIQETLAPGSFTVANTLHEMGTTSLQAGNSGSATDYFRRAVESLESQRAKLARADDRRSGFAAQHIDYYRDYTTQLLATDQPELAFHTVERSRARGLLEMLAERDLFFSNDLSADLERERRQVDAEYDQIQAGIGRLNPGKDAEQIQRLVAQMRELRDKQQEIRERIRNASPRLAALQYPEPLDLQRVQQMLDPGTVLLSYMVTSQKTFLFAIAGGPPKGRSAFAVFPLPISQDALRAKIESFRSEIQRPHERGQQWLQQGQDLYTVLVKPAGDFIAASSRVLISPDGPLHALPFGALVMEQTSARSGVSVPRYWIEAKPLHVVTSATLYAELRKGRRQAPVSVIAFGDPNYSAVSRDQIEALVDPEVGSILRSGNSLEPLPSTRAEVAALAGLYGKQATIYLGRQATEERAKSISKDARYLHFAVHGILNERFPLNSALALSVPDKPGEGQDNGLLQAWEIFEHVRVNAELVVLSACETALGREMGGEGLVGLTRAFQYAGARSIVASLWSVGDESTAELMKRFYRYLKANKTKDEALRSAQLDLIRQRGNVSHPFHWAAFELIGDWK
jgi:CHAT domain-containing protein